MTKILLVGCGHMGSALLNAWIDIKSYSFTVIDPFNYNFLKRKYVRKKIKFLNQTPTQKTTPLWEKTNSYLIIQQTSLVRFMERIQSNSVLINRQVVIFH